MAINVSADPILTDVTLPGAIKWYFMDDADPIEVTALPVGTFLEGLVHLDEGQHLLGETVQACRQSSHLVECVFGRCRSLRLHNLKTWNDGVQVSKHGK